MSLMFACAKKEIKPWYSWIHYLKAKLVNTAYNSIEQYNHLSTARTPSFVSSRHIEIHLFENKIWSKEIQRPNNLFCHLIFWSNEFSGGKLRSVFNCQDHFGWEMTDILRWLTSSELTSQIYSITWHSGDEMMVRVEYADVHFKLGRRKKCYHWGPKLIFNFTLLCDDNTDFSLLRQKTTQSVSQVSDFLNMKLPTYMHWPGPTSHSYFSMLSPIDIEIGISISELQKPLLPQCIFFHPPGLE